jgi:Putative peptidoglycan binding domain
MKKIVIGTIAAVSLSVLAATSAAGQGANPLQFAQLKIPTGRSIETLNMSAVPDIDRNKVRQVQNVLKTKGFDPGPLNGVVGEKTKEAVQQFQDRFGIKATGAIDNQTLFALGVVGGSKAAAVEIEQRPQPEPKKPSKKKPSASKKTAKSSGRDTNKGARKPSHWCADYANASENCGFTSLQQCRASVSGAGGSCRPD